MPIKLTTRQQFLIGALCVVVLILALSEGVKKNVDLSAVIPANIAAGRALQVAYEQGPSSGGSLTPPTGARGQVTTLGQAYEFIFNQSPAPNDPAALNPAYPVWLVVLQGQFVEHVPASADGAIPAKDVVHTQLAMILDGDTTQPLERVLVSPSQPLDVSALPVLPLPAGGPSATTTPEPTSMFAPAPTQSP